MTKVIVYHRGYGCQTGCCGHAIEMNGEEIRFEFEHPYGEDLRAFAERLVTEECGPGHVADLDWENCFICDD